MNTLAERLKSCREDAGLTQAELTKKARLKNQSIIGGLESGSRKTSSHTPLIANALGVNTLWLSNGIGDKYGGSALPEHHAVPRDYPRVIGTARMGDKGYYLDLEGGNGHIELEAAPGSIAIHVRGDSMKPAIRDGWYVIVEPDGRPTIGEYVLLVFHDGRKMVKEFVIEKPDCYQVESVNGGERITVMKDELQSMQPISAVVPPSKHKQ